jgi:hypothetical protein
MKLYELYSENHIARSLTTVADAVTWSAGLRYVLGTALVVAGTAEISRQLLVELFLVCVVGLSTYCVVENAAGQEEYCTQPGRSSSHPTPPANFCWLASLPLQPDAIASAGCRHRLLGFRRQRTRRLLAVRISLQVVIISVDVAGFEVATVRRYKFAVTFMHVFRRRFPLPRVVAVFLLLL